MLGLGDQAVHGDVEEPGVLRQMVSLLTGRKDEAPPADDKGEQDQQKGDGGEKKKEYRKKTCSDCNKGYCLSQGLHICEGKGLEEVFTTCFRMYYACPCLSTLPSFLIRLKCLGACDGCILRCVLYLARVRECYVHAGAGILEQELKMSEHT